VSESGNILGDSVRRLLEDHEANWARPEAPGWIDGLWPAVDALGLPLALLSEAQGGFDLPASDALNAVRIAGAFAAPLPIGEAMLAHWLLASAGMERPEGAITIALSPADLELSAEADGVRLRGSAARVPFARHVEWIVVCVAQGPRTSVVLLSASELQITHGDNVAGEPRDSFEIDMSVPRDRAGQIPDLDAAKLRALGAALRCQSLAGSIERVLAMTLQYVQERTQFGRALGSFQVVQHNLAVMAGQAVAAGAAADMAAEAFATGDLLPIAIGKARAGEAAGVVATIAHQMHGAIGFTQEHALGRFTRRLWAWREEYGAEAEWAAHIGLAAAQAGPRGLWPLLARVS